VKSTQFAHFIVPLNTSPNYFQKHLPLSSKDGVDRIAGIKSGFIHLEPGDGVHWHTTGEREEVLIILRGEAFVRMGTKITAGHGVTGPAFVYIPRDTGHEVLNKSTEAVEYVYLTAEPPAPARVLRVNEGGPGWEGSRPG
jgi:uncharacterized RmlC-like cupin family protein